MSERKSNLAIIGGGIMGGDIAVIFSAGGWDVHVMSPSQKTRDALPGRIEAGMKKVDVAAGQAGKVFTYSRLEDIGWKQIDLVIEAATEDLALKQKLFLQIEELAGPDVPLASNTSNFQISEIGKPLKHKNRFLGLHFFMPAHLVPLVEVISGSGTDPRLAESMCALMKKMGKAPIWVKKDIPGFVGNRIQHAMMREALYLMEDGVVSAEDVDIAVRFGFGFRFLACGPILQKEMSGWDTNCRAGSALYPHLHNEAAFPSSMKKMVDQGHVGMKTLRGVWEWTEESAAKEKARIEQMLQTGLEIIHNDLKKIDG
jgi:3-hydroxybutyryl-CoA dehydrogenase